jgi:hypothetical protein
MRSLAYDASLLLGALSNHLAQIIQPDRSGDDRSGSISVKRLCIRQIPLTAGSPSRNC